MAKTCKSNALFGESGERASNAYLTCPEVRDSDRKRPVIPDDPRESYGLRGKDLLPWDRDKSYQLVGEVTAHQGLDG